MVLPTRSRQPVRITFGPSHPSSLRHHSETASQWEPKTATPYARSTHAESGAACSLPQACSCWALPRPSYSDRSHADTPLPIFMVVIGVYYVIRRIVIGLPKFLILNVHNSLDTLTCLLSTFILSIKYRTGHKINHMVFEISEPLVSLMNRLYFPTLCILTYSLNSNIYKIIAFFWYLRNPTSVRYFFSNNQGAYVMAKGQKRSNREIKKPKAAKKPSIEAQNALLQLQGKMPLPKGVRK